MTAWQPSEYVLAPIRRWWLRLIVTLAVASPAFVSRADWYKKVIFAAGMAGWIGSYPVARIRNQRFERAMFVLFIPVPVKRWSLDRFSGVQPESEPHDPYALGWLWIFGGWWIWSYVLDWMIPWMGGPYKLWLRALSGKRVLAWQGSNEDQFRANLDLLLTRTGLSLHA